MGVAKHLFCIRCIRLTDRPIPIIPADTLNAFNLANDLDVQSLRTTLLNQEIPKLMKHVDDWRDSQRQELISALTKAVIESHPNMTDLAKELGHVEPLHPAFAEWIAWVKKDLYEAVKHLLVKNAPSKILDPVADEFIAMAVATHKETWCAEADAQFQAYREKEYNRRCAEIDAEINKDLLAYKNDPRLAAETHKANIDSSFQSSVVRPS